MGLVDLRGREHEPTVESLLALAHSSPASLQRARDSYRAGAWKLIGWDEDGGLVGCVGVQRDGSNVVIRSIAVHPDWQRRGIGRALIEALARSATGATGLSAETDSDAVLFYERCGFAVLAAGTRGGRARFGCVRGLEPFVAPDADVSAATLAEVEFAVRTAWSRETADDPDDWSPENPAAGHCGATALVVRELLGGEILVAGVVRDGLRVERHAWNRLQSGLSLDLTREQFRDGEMLERPEVGEPLFAQRHRERFELFRRRVRAALRLP